METMLIVAATAWLIAGIEFMVAYQRETRARLEKRVLVAAPAQ